MSYRTFKHLLGETSLERKCRFIFGGGILALVTLSFYWYGQKTEALVIGQQTVAARVLIEPIVMKEHLQRWGLESTRQLKSFIDEMAGDRAPLNQNPKYHSRVVIPGLPVDPEQPELDDFEKQALARFLASTSRAASARKPGDAPKPYVFADGAPMWDARILPGRKEYQYIEAVTYQARCMRCHATMMRADADGKFAFPKADDLAFAVVVKLPMEQTTKQIHRNRAYLITAALVTAILAMVTSYVIVRYVIVKPVKHLRDVSDAIAAGKLNIRSQIQTGDEFEELSHAFNRMLHNLVAMQQELRQVNNDLDKKVDELAQANLALFEMNRLKSDFLATMSHELRTPLNSIIGFSEVLSGSDSLSDRQKRYAANIQSSGKMLLGMINDILDLAKIESGKMEVRVEDFSIRDICEGLVNLARPVAERKSIDLECRLDEAIPLLRQDPGKLRQVIYNLLSNAIKFTPEGGRVTLRAQAEGRHLIIEVEDTGIGIAEEDRERVFEKFRQAGGVVGTEGGVLTREHQGTGLGLSIVRELSKLLGGDVSLDSQAGRGSTFTVRIPLQIHGNRRFEVALGDERIDLSKARRVEPRASLPHAPLVDAAHARRGNGTGLGGEPVDRGRPRP